jgi:Zn-dependent protease with chaperone function
LIVPPLEADATEWTGRRMGAREEQEAALAAWRVLPLDRETVGPLYAETDAIARALGIAAPRLFYRPDAPAFMRGAIAAATASPPAVILTAEAVALPNERRLALLAHELAHVAAGHGAAPLERLFLGWHRCAALVALGGALALASPPLILAALAALAVAHWAALRCTVQSEQEADAIAVRLLGSVAPLLAQAGQHGWRTHLALVWTCYPTGRPWLYRWAAAELVEMRRRSKPGA